MPGSRDGTIPAGRSAAPALILLPALLYFSACGLGSLTQQESSGPVVKVGEESYSKADLNRFFDSRLNEFRDSVDVDVVKSALLDSFVEEKLLLREANRLSIEPDPQDLKSMREGLAASQGTAPEISTKADQRMEQNLKENLKIQRYLRDHLFKEISATQEECEAYYKDHLSEFISNDVVKVREILVEDEAKAQRIQALLKAGRNKNFGELARIHSKAPTADDGGDLGTFQRGDLPEEFEKAIFPLAPGTISKIVRSQYGYHLFYVEEKILAHQQKFYEAADQIQEKLMLERQRAALDKELAALANQTPIRVDREKLDFQYVGTGLASRGGKS
jgi:parvulin-like peptidyl-prolyl isomerase